MRATLISLAQPKLRNLLMSTGLWQSLLVVFGNAFAQGLSAISLIIITRQLGPVNFGEFSVGFALLLILNRLNDLGLTVVVQRYGAQAESHEVANKIFSYTARLKLIGACIIALVGAIISGPLTSLLNFEQPLIIYAAFFLSPATVLYEQLQAMLQSLHRFAQSVAANAIQASIKVLGALVLLATGGTASLPIFIWYMAAPASAGVVFGKLFPSWVKLELRQNFRDQHLLTKDMTKHAAVGLVAAGIIENIDILIVQGYLNTYETGLLGGVSRIALLFNLMAYSLGTVLNPRVAKYKSTKHIGSYLKKAWLVVGASVLGFLAYLPFSGFAIQYSIGPEYLAGVGVLNILMAAAFISIAVMPFVALFFSFNSPWFFSVSGVLQLVIILAGNLVFVPLFGLEAAAWTRLVARIAFFVLAVGWGWWAYQVLHKNERKVDTSK